MAQKYLSSYGIWVNSEEGDVLSDQQLDNVDGFSSTDITQLTPNGNISQDTVASEEETLEETQEVLEELHDENEQKIEETPEEVTEEVVQASNETFLLCLGRLGFGTTDVNKLKLGFESYNTPISNLRTTNRAIKNVIKEIRKHRRISK